jgi:hypothetical protein
MYLHFNERSGLMAPLVAEDVHEIIMKVRVRLALTYLRTHCCSVSGGYMSCSIALL